jgi:ribosomal protein S18 acetylase RimI-like enzyme
MITLRRAGETDVAALGLIATAAYEHYVPRIGRAPAPMTADYAGPVGQGQAWVAVENGQIAGFVILVAHPDHLLLENVAVHPAAQGRGVGTRLLELAQDQARRLHLGEIRLYTHQAMTENQAYYARRGYAETHRAGQDGFERVFFTKRLAG